VERFAGFVYESCELDRHECVLWLMVDGLMTKWNDGRTENKTNVFRVMSKVGFRWIGFKLT
ncbi:MAG: hypothetical protein QF886_19985, partial [Planctomycetota bacterium]|nr:hypothetical protein [Planctomycetota bacterium]